MSDDWRAANPSLGVSAVTVLALLTDSRVFVNLDGDDFAVEAFYDETPDWPDAYVCWFTKDGSQ